MGIAMWPYWQGIQAADEEEAPDLENDVKCWATWAYGVVRNPAAVSLLVERGDRAITDAISLWEPPESAPGADPGELAAACERLRADLQAGDANTQTLAQFYPEWARGPAGDWVGRLSSDLQGVATLSRWAAQRGVRRIWLILG